MSEGKWPSVAVLGAGAVGSYFGGMLARAGAPVTLIGRAAHVDAIRREGLCVESAGLRERIQAAASTETRAASTSDVVLLCVKAPDTEDAARRLAPHLASGTIVVSLQNGVDNVARIRAVTGIDAIPAVVYVAVEVTVPGHIRHMGRGDIIVGDLPNAGPADEARRRRLALVFDLFERAHVPCRVSDDIESDLWTKLIMNCTYNPISALTRMRYGRLVQDPGARGIMREVVEEIVAVAHAAGVRLGNPAVLADAVYRLADTMPGAISSTAQDLARGRRTEIDALNGYVTRRGAELGVATPVNGTLHALVKLLESAIVHP